MPVVLVLNNIPYLITNSAGQPYTNYDAVIRQVKSYQTFVDVVTPDTNQTILNFYFPNQVATNRDNTGLYTNITGSPFVSWTIQNPQPATANNLNLIESRNGNSSTQSLVKASSPAMTTWTLTQGSGAATRVETRQVSFQGSPATSRIEMDTISYAGAISPAYACQETYQSYPWGWELAQTSVPNSPAPLVTSYEYYDNLNHPEAYSASGNGQVKQIIYPDGYWEKRVYEDMGYDIPDIGDPMYGTMYVLNPWPAGGATSPDAAGLDNANLTIYYLVSQSIAGPFYSRMSCQVDTMHGGVLTSHLIEGEGMASDPVKETVSGSWFYDWDWDSIEGLPDQKDDYDQDASLGLAGHPLGAFKYGGQSTANLYDHGVFDSNANTFNLDENNHIYAGDVYRWDDPYNSYGINTLYPDHCETDIQSSLRGWWSINQVELNASTPSVPRWNYVSIYQPDFLQSINYFIPDVTSKSTRIFHGGNLTQTENYVYTSPYNPDGDSNPQWNRLYRVRYYNDSLGRATNVVRIDDVTGQPRTVYSADYRGTSGVDGSLLLSETDETGSQTSYTYDSLQRVQTTTVTGYGAQPNTVTSYAYNADGAVTGQVIASVGLSQSESWAYDLAGRTTNMVDRSGIATVTSYSADNQTVTQTSPGGITTIQQQYPNRQTESLTGSGVVGQYYDWPVYNDPSGSQIYGPYFSLDNFVSDQLKITYYGAFNSPRWQMHGTTATGLPSGMCGRWARERRTSPGRATPTLRTDRFMKRWDHLGFPPKPLDLMSWVIRTLPVLVLVLSLHFLTRRATLLPIRA